jgi:deoxyadenosine/deoxycytidine kinase
MHQHIVIEGPLGVGKTTLAYKLAEKMEGETLLEDVEENPFLVNFYKNPEQYAFQTQIYFLLRRYHQAKHKSQLGLFKRVLISDYLFDKDRIFAKNNLNDDEFWLYEQLFQVLKKRIAPPDLVIFLQARVDVLVERIKMRKKGYEKNISPTYLENINQAFNEYFFHYAETPLLVINASDIDFVHVPEDFEDLVHQITTMKSGTQYYVPMSSRKK